MLEHTQLAVWLKTRQHTRSVMVVKKLATQFEVELAIELCNTFADVLRLDLEVFLVVKSYLHLFIFCKFACKGKKKS